MLCPFLPSYRPPLLPQSHRNESGLIRLATSRAGSIVWKDSLSSILGGEKAIDLRGLYHFDPRGRTPELSKAIDYCMLALGMREWYTSKRIRRGLNSLLRSYYAARSNGCAVVLFESCRDLIVDRFREFTRQGIAIEQRPVPNVTIDATWRRPIINCQQKPLKILDGLPLSIADLPFAIPDEHRPNHCYLRGSGHDRWIARGKESWQLLGRWQFWCVAEPYIDDLTLRSGRYTAKVHRLIGNRVNPSRIMTWMAFHPTAQSCYNLCLDFDPWTERVLSIRYVEMDLSEYLDLDPRMDYWLSAAMHHLHEKPLSDEQVDTPKPTPET